jgi:hypothetical protein
MSSSLRLANVPPHFAPVALLTLILAAMAPLDGQDEPVSVDAAGAISTDRPAVTNSSVVLPAGNLQVENGFLETGSQGRSVVDGSETLVRFGVGTRTELRFTAPDYYHNLNTGQGSGFGDLAVGAKEQLVSTPGGFDVSAIVFLSFPTGAFPLSSGGYDPGLQLPWSRSLSASLSVAGMFSAYWPTQGHTRNLFGESTILLDRQLTGPWDAFVEYAGDFGALGGPRHLLHFGTALKLTRRHQLDLHVGLGLSSAAVDHLVGIGYSFRVPANHP